MNRARVSRTYAGGFRWVARLQDHRIQSERADGRPARSVDRQKSQSIAATTRNGVAGRTRQQIAHAFSWSGIQNIKETWTGSSKSKQFCV